MGKLVLSNLRLKFINYNEVDEEINGLRVPPFDLHSLSQDSGELSSEDLDLLNVYDLKFEPVAEANSSYILLSIYCNDFRCIEYQLRNSDLVKNFLESLDRANRNDLLELPRLWEILQNEHPFVHPEDWAREEGCWLKRGSEFRITQSNEDFQLCPSLPPSFPSLKFYLTDVNLIQMVSPQLKNQRVPLISYAFFGDDGHRRILMRSPYLTPDVDNLLFTAIAPLRVINLTSLLPSMPVLISAHRKLRMACFIYNREDHFLCRVGKWLKLIAKILGVLHDLVSVLRQEASVILVEESDDTWNPFMSSLIQIVVDPRRRTIVGFEALVSKEWLYFAGLPFLSTGEQFFYYSNTYL